jgi:hypothetical protein
MRQQTIGTDAAKSAAAPGKRRANGFKEDRFGHEPPFLFLSFADDSAYPKDGAV